MVQCFIIHLGCAPCLCPILVPWYLVWFLFWPQLEHLDQWNCFCSQCCIQLANTGPLHTAVYPLPRHAVHRWSMLSKIRETCILTPSWLICSLTVLVLPSQDDKTSTGLRRNFSSQTVSPSEILPPLRHEYINKSILRMYIGLPIEQAYAFTWAPAKLLELFHIYIDWLASSQSM